VRRAARYGLQLEAAQILRRGCVFRGKVDTDSAANWTLIPRQTGQGFQGKLDT